MQYDDDDQLDELTDQFADLNVNALTIDILGMITGHGGMSGINPEINRLTPYTPPTDTNLRLCAFNKEGMCNFLNKDYEHSIDDYLSYHAPKFPEDNILSSEIMQTMSDNYFKILPSVVDKSHKQSKSGVVFSCDNNYGRIRERHEVSDKFYQGLHEGETRHSRLTTTGPLLIIYNVVLKREHDMLPVSLNNNKPFVIPLTNNITLTEVIKSIKKILNKENSGVVAEREHGDWYRELFAPSVTANLLKPSELAGYRNSQVYIGQSRHVPLNVSAVRDTMPVLFELLKEEPDAGVRAVLGHFIFVHIHPYMDGNGRMGRFLMNVMLASGGYPWTVIPVEEWATYMDALEKASADLNIKDFASFIAYLVNEDLKGIPVAKLRK